ncbi:hypothetical protein EIP86_000110 [Pleurotus ostreatoroseus]|nr:hypothetical protein EIP86_000110 [Pleurotus ostreatoroseus]
MSTNAVSSTSQIVTLPHIPELFDPNFLDVLLPQPASAPLLQQNARVEPKNPMIEALKADANHVYTTNGSPAFASTLSPTLDAFEFLGPASEPRSIAGYLDKAWNEDPSLTLRIIWNIRSIHEGKSDKLLFYRAYGWLYKNHPRTAIENLHLLVDPVCSVKKGADPTVSHGYWKDLLNIVALAVGDELRPVLPKRHFLDKPRPQSPYWKHGCIQRPMRTQKTDVEVANKAQQEKSRRSRIAANESYHSLLVAKLADKTFRALYIAVARLFAEKLKQDLGILQQLETCAPGKEHGDLLRQLSLAGKWAPTPGASHDRSTNLSTAIALLALGDLTTIAKPKLSTGLDRTDIHSADAHIVRSFYQRWILRPLRQTVKCPEPLMTANCWGDIAYTRVPSVSMKQNMPLFFKHDPQRFEEYLIDVESGKKKISGATLLPHEVVAQAVKLHNDLECEVTNPHSLRAVRARVAEMYIRTLDQQWKALVDRLRQCGALENSIAICDVSGSMGSLWGHMDKRAVDPIYPAVALSLVLAQVAKPPFANAFITFSASPQFVQLDPSKSLSETVLSMIGADWGNNTNLNAVFLDLLLPLAIKNKLKQEDMIKRLFIFSDMQFDASQPSKANDWAAPAQTNWDATSWDDTAPGASWDDEASAQQQSTTWETNHDVIEKAFKTAGYEMPEIVYWNLAGGHSTTPVTQDKKGVALMSGFSPSMLKAFLGEEDEDPEWDMVDGDEDAKKKQEELTPFEMMKKVLSRKSYEGLVVTD